MIKVVREITGELFLSVAFLAVTAELVRGGPPEAAAAFFLILQVIAFLIFSLPGALALALSSTFVSIAALLITGNWFLLAAIAAFWIILSYLNSVRESLESLEGEYNMQVENLENGITAAGLEVKRLQSLCREVRSRNERYLKLGGYAVGLGKTLDQAKIYSLLRQFLTDVFPGGKIRITSGITDQYSRWVKKNMSPLLVEDSAKDYRFSKSPPEILSLMECPLTRGKRVLGAVRVESGRLRFTSSDLRLLNTVASLSSIALEKARLFLKVKELSVTDSLTGLHTNTYFKERLQEEVGRAARYNQNFSVVIFDIDKFKKINDRFGHGAGDKVLKKVAAAMKNSVRDTDIPGRYGGEEFSLILFDTAKEQALFVAEKIRKKIEKEEFDLKGEKIRVTVTAGISFFPKSPTAGELIRAADSALYRGKNKGRNRVEVQDE